MTAFALYHSSELMDYQEDIETLCDSPFAFRSGWYVCPSIPEGAIIDHRMRGPFETTVEAFAEAARIAIGSALPPYPQFCRRPDRCAGLSYCPRDPTCAD